MGLFNSLFSNNNETKNTSKDDFITIVNTLVTRATDNITRPDFLYDMKNDNSIINGMINTLNTKKDNAYNEEEYFMSLIDNNCYFLVQDEFVTAWLIDMIQKHKLYSQQEALSTFSTICDQARKIVRQKASEAYMDAIKEIDSILAKSNNSPVFQMESYYIVLRLKSDIYCSLFDEMYSSTKYKEIFTNIDIPMREKLDCISQSISDKIRQKDSAIKKILYR